MRSFLLIFEMCSVDGISQVSVAESRSLVGMCFRFDSMALCGDACYHCENFNSWYSILQPIAGHTEKKRGYSKHCPLPHVGLFSYFESVVLHWLKYQTHNPVVVNSNPRC